MRKIAYDQKTLLRAKSMRDELEKQAAVPRFRRMAGGFAGAAQKASGGAGTKQTYHGKPRSTSEWFRAGAAMAGGGALFGIGAAAMNNAAGGATRKIHEAGRDKRFNRMVGADPSLRKEPGARHMFAVLDRASPYMAGEPVLAAATVRQMLETPSIVEGGIPSLDPRTIKGIIDVEQAHQNTRYPAIAGKPTIAKMPEVEFPD